MRRTRFILALSALHLIMPKSLSAPADSPGPSSPIVSGNSQFAFELYKVINRPGDNVFFSPFSISTCLGMTLLGARGETAAEMARTLHLNSSPADIAAAFSQLHAQLNPGASKGGLELESANGLWAQQSHPFLPEYLQVLRDGFGARTEQADFRHEAEPTRLEINQWVARKTRDKITDLIPSGMLDASTRLVLVNAVYFKGKWERQFKASHTAPAPFTVASGQKKDVPMMNQTGRFNYAELENAQLLELPYAGSDLSMVLLLPKTTDGLQRMETALDARALRSALEKARPKEVQVVLPKFRLTQQVTLTESLQKLGMRLAFTPQADFSGMDGDRDLFISAVIHKAYVDVNEEGTEAAAATGTAMRTTSLQIRPVFRADHPFVFLIRDAKSGSMLFLGRVADPAA